MQVILFNKELSLSSCLQALTWDHCGSLDCKLKSYCELDWSKDSIHVYDIQDC